MPSLMPLRIAARHRERSRVFHEWLTSAVSFAVMVETALAVDPQVDRIERYGTNQVTIHFNTDPNRTYTLQHSSALTYGTWTNLFIAPAMPGPNHYVVPHAATNALGFYRLAVGP